MRRVWLEVRADEVVPGDLYANGATVTLSRKRRRGDNEWFTHEWVIKCGPDWALSCDRDRMVVVGRFTGAADA